MTLTRSLLAIGLVLVLTSGCSSGSGSGGSGGGSGASAGSGGNGGGSGGSGGGSGGGASFDCASGCQSFPQSCPNDDVATCTADCQNSYASFAKCKSQLDAAFLCTLSRPASDFHCGADGKTEINADVCTPELSGLAACLQSP